MWVGETEFWVSLPLAGSERRYVVNGIEIFVRQICQCSHPHIHNVVWHISNSLSYNLDWIGKTEEQMMEYTMHELQ